ncbi:MAG: Acrylyl-CoA reductase AcuI [Alphaproteobacteria bacterium MarineAlpha9_Bin4]|nr:hypothetical protein [Pelagibacterales bacterium]PPR25557.1 MAG: Acrylyl-CoA reductase AcuI [Alphaproteobacteria bacterium MarineAlpha9_Bin4]|tara:strand:- start:1181 stop:2176 length:996 start_codon:yes stop_codon:yes gene_type:complete
MFKAIIIDKKENNEVVAKLVNLNDDDLPANDVIIEVEYSTLNYKDCLAISNKSPVVRQFPMIPGIDLAGKVINSDVKNFQIGDKVLLNGWGYGEVKWGGLSEHASINSKHLIKIPEKLSSLEAMSIGTAGYTAMLAILEIENKNIDKNDSEILVTGSSGGVGSVAISILSDLGYKVVAATSRLNNKKYLKNLGAKEVIEYKDLLEKKKPLEKERWAAAIDVLGGPILDRICASMKYEGIIAVCGLAADTRFNTTVFPLILRGVSLIGIDSVYKNNKERIIAWDKLNKIYNKDKFLSICKIITLEDAIKYSYDIIDRKVVGRVIIDLKKKDK